MFTLINYSFRMHCCISLGLLLYRKISSTLLHINHSISKYKQKKAKIFESQKY